MESDNFKDKTESEIMESIQSRFGRPCAGPGDKAKHPPVPIPLLSQLSIQWIDELKEFLIRGCFSKATKGEFFHLELAFGLDQFRVPTKVDRSVLVDALFDAMRLNFQRVLRDGEVDHILTKEGVESSVEQE